MDNYKILFLQKIRNRFFPIYSGEFLKFTFLAAICFLVCLNFTMLRNIKDTLIITNPEMGIATVPFIRTWLLMPLMLVFMKAYASLSSRFTQDKVTYIILSVFFIYFTTFVIVIYPYHNYFKWDSFANSITNYYVELKPLAEIFRFWSFSVYYCLAEIWGLFVVLILFWGTSNRCNTSEEAKRFYSPIIFLTNISGIVSSQISIVCSKGDLKYYLFPDMNVWDATLSSLTFLISIVTLLIMILFYILNSIILSKQVLQKVEQPPTREEMSLFRIIGFVFKDAKFRPLIIMVFAYFFCTGVMELVWKYYLKEVYPNPNDFNDFLSVTTIYIGFGAIFMSLFISGNLIRRFNWRITALITPVLLMFPILIIIINFLFNQSADFLTVTVYLCTIYFCLNRICKFSLFDLSKEIACVEFTQHEQIKAKTVLDGMIPNLGRTCEAFSMQILLLAFSSMNSIILLVLCFMLVIHFLWAYFIPVKTKTLEVPI